jgi:hypothetical protein
MTSKAETYILELPASDHCTENGLTIFDAQIRQQQISELAYRMAEKRGFESGHELKDWLEAESEAEASSKAGGWRPNLG